MPKKDKPTKVKPKWSNEPKMPSLDTGIPEPVFKEPTKTQIELEENLEKDFEGILKESRAVKTALGNYKELGFVGEVSEVNIELVENILDSGYIPVVSTVGCDREGNAYNINGYIRNNRLICP